MELPANFDQVLKAFIKRKKSFELADRVVGHNSGMFEYILEQLEREAEGEDEDTKEQYYPGWTHEQLKFLLQCLRAQEI